MRSWKSARYGWQLEVARSLVSHDRSRRDSLVEVASHLPIPLGTLAKRSKAECVVFNAHAVVVGTSPPHLAHIVRCKTAVRFEADLRWLLRHYRFVSYGDVQARLNGGHALPANAALLTFDDGFAEVYSVIRPLLRKLGVPGLTFITGSVLDNRTLSNDCKASLCIEMVLSMDRAQQLSVLEAVGGSNFTNVPRGDLAELLRRALVHGDALTDRLWSFLELDEASYLKGVRPYLTSEQVGEMVAEGFSFGAHAMVHRLLQDLSRSQLEEDIVRSCELVSQLTGEPTVPFAFPYYGKGIRRDWLASIRTSHPVAGLFFDVGGLRREGSLVWHRIGVERLDEPVSTTIKRAYLRAEVLGMSSEKVGRDVRGSNSSPGS